LLLYQNTHTKKVISSGSWKNLHIHRPKSSWETSTTPISAGWATQEGTSRRSLEYTDDNLPTQVTEEMRTGDSLLDLRITNKEEMVRDVKTGAVLAAAPMRWWSSES